MDYGYFETNTSTNTDVNNDKNEDDGWKLFLEGRENYGNNITIKQDVDDEQP